MIWDHGKKDGPGAYGEGLGAPLGEMRWLDDMAGPLTFRRLRMGEAGDLRFPYHLLKHEVRLPLALPHRCGIGPMLTSRARCTLNVAWHPGIPKRIAREMAEDTMLAL